MSRRAIRESVFKLLFRREFNSDEEMPEQIKFFFEDEDESKKMKEADKAVVEERYKGVVEHIEEIDKIIEDNTKGWTISRFGRVEITLIRLAVFEVKFDENIPNAVAIDEAVELAKKFGGDGAPAFINGVLANIVAGDDGDKKAE